LSPSESTSAACSRWYPRCLRASRRVGWSFRVSVAAWHRYRLRCAPPCPYATNDAELRGVPLLRCRRGRKSTVTFSHALVLTLRDELKMCVRTVELAIVTAAYVGCHRKPAPDTDIPLMRFVCSSTLEAKGSDLHQVSTPGCAAPSGFLNLLTRYSSLRRPSLVSCW
jgi:hypothetical protein